MQQFPRYGFNGLIRLAIAFALFCLLACSLLSTLSLGAQTLRPEAPSNQELLHRAAVTGVSCQSVSDEVRILVGLDRTAPYRAELVHNPNRLYFDFTGTRPPSRERAIELGACVSVVERVRMAEHEPGTTRVVLYLNRPMAFDVTVSKAPPGLVVSLRGLQGERARSSTEPDTRNSRGRITLNPPPRPEPASNTPRLPLAPVTGVFCQADSDEIRVLVGVERNVPYHAELLHNPYRLYFDLTDTRPSGSARAIDLGACASLVQRVRIVEHEPGRTRVVLYLTKPIAYAVTASINPPGMTLSLRDLEGERTRSLAVAGRADKPVTTIPSSPSRAPIPQVANATTTGGSTLAPGATNEDLPDMPPRIGDLLSAVQRADRGDPTAQAALGRAHESGELGHVHYLQAIRWYERAAEQGNVYAAIRLGDMYANGIGTDRNLEQAARHYGMVAQQSQLARSRLRDLSKSAIQQTEVVAQQPTQPAPPSGPRPVLQHSNPKATSSGSDLIQPASTETLPPQRSPVLAADVFGPVLAPTRQETRVQPSPLDALELDKLGTLNRGTASLSAMAVLPTITPPRLASLPPSSNAASVGFKFDPARSPRDPAAAARWYLEAAEKGIAEAQYRLGNIYLEGNGVARDPAKAASWFRRAAEQGHASAQNNFGLLCLNGSGVHKNDAEALKWFIKSAQAGDAGGQNNLGAAYIAGSGVRVDYAEGARWLRKAADQGSIEAEYTLGTLYANGRGVPRDSATAVQWFRSAATKGYARAQVVLGQMYLSGQGTARDYTEARQWLERAALQGLPEAQVAVAQIFRDGLGVTRNGPEALKWYKKAAGGRYAEAQYALGEIYMEGKLVPADPVLAYAWFAIAASNGQQRGLKAINSIAPKMTINQIAAGQKQAYALAAQLAASP
jgi:TPR repeat protein